MKSNAVRALDWPDAFAHFGTRGELDVGAVATNQLCSYLRTFIDLWEPQLADQNGRLRWRVVRPREVSSMVAMVFETETVAEPLSGPSNTDEYEWAGLLDRLLADEASAADDNGG
jgi:hypothetical protein